MIDYNHIKQVHLEISTRCNASCPLCPRNTSGYDEDLGFPVHDMTLIEAKRIFTPPFVRQLNKVLINGNFGDFITAKDNLAIVEYLLLCNPELNISICTNASGGKPVLWERLGQLGVEVGFDIDGLEDTHKLYRRNTNWQQVIKNAKIFMAAGGTAVWRMIKFDHNAHQIAECQRLSKELGFSKFIILDDGRDTGPVYDRNGNYVYKLGNDMHFVTVVQYPKTIDIWKEWQSHDHLPENALKRYETIPIKKSVTCKAKEASEIYITATGEVYPCCWLGFYPKLEYKHPWQRDNMFLKELVMNNNAIEVGIAEAIKWFNGVEASWQKKAYTEGRLLKCDEECGCN